ncbi:MAG: M23 family metallopeptidase [Erysipelotrichaceae bacterium]|nr:M23 family metallopeptidase [Erysipelotrichaceae bacterium]
MKKLILGLLLLIGCTGCTSSKALSFISPLDNYHVSREFGALEGYKAVELSLNKDVDDSFVRASEGGKVISVDKEDKGYVVVVDHGQGYQTLYRGLDTVAIQVNQKINQGDAIGELKGRYATMSFVIAKDGERLSDTQQMIAE